MYDVGSFLAVDRGASGIILRKSGIISKSAGQEECFGFSFGGGDMVLYYYRSLVYADITEQKHLKKARGEGVMAVTVEQFSKWWFKVQDTVVYERGDDRTSWIVQAPFCCMYYINDPMNLPREETTTC